MSMNSNLKVFNWFKLRKYINNTHTHIYDEKNYMIDYKSSLGNYKYLFEIWKICSATDIKNVSSFDTFLWWHQYRWQNFKPIDLYDFGDPYLWICMSL